MEAHDREPPAALEEVHRLRQRHLELFKLPIEENPKSLKGARRRMLARLARADRATHDLGKVACGPQRPLAPCRNNRCCNCLSKPFFPIGANHLPELSFVGAREVLRSGLAARGVHAHVERSLAREAETALRIPRAANASFIVENLAWISSRRGSAIARCEIAAGS